MSRCESAQSSWPRARKSLRLLKQRAFPIRIKLMKNQNVRFTAIILFALGSFALPFAPSVFGVVPPPDGAYPGFNTAEGQNALHNLTTGSANTGIGWYSLFSGTTASFNTGVGAGALALNTADENTAIGTATLLLNTASGNTAVGSRALLNNTTGGTLTNIGVFEVGPNVAVGAQALESNTLGSANTAIGYQALHSFTAGPMGAEQLGVCNGCRFSSARQHYHRNRQQRIGPPSIR